MLFLFVSLTASGLFERRRRQQAEGGIREKLREILAARGPRPRLLDLAAVARGSEKLKPPIDTATLAKNATGRVRGRLNGTRFNTTLLHNRLRGRRLHNITIGTTSTRRPCNKTVITRLGINTTSTKKRANTTVITKFAINTTSTKKRGNATAAVTSLTATKRTESTGDTTMDSKVAPDEKKADIADPRTEETGAKKADHATTNTTTLRDTANNGHKGPSVARREDATKPRLFVRFHELISKTIGIAVIVAAAGVIVLIVGGVIFVRGKAAPNKEIVQADRPLLDPEQVY
jgi:hypothetical protein